MSNTPPDPPARPGLLPVNGEPFQPPKAPEPPGDEELLPSWDVEPPPAIPVALPVGADEVTDAPVAVALPMAQPLPEEVEPEAPAPEPPAAEGPPTAAPTTIACPAC